MQRSPLRQNGYYPFFHFFTFVPGKNISPSWAVVAARYGYLLNESITIERMSWRSRP